MSSSDLHRPILITGICGRLGREVARQLHRSRRVVGVDRREFRGRPKDVEHFKIDIRRKKLKEVFRRLRPAAVVHLGVMHDPRVDQGEHHSWNLIGFQRVLDYVAQFEVPKLVVLSSANVYGPRPDNAQFLDEDSPLLGASAFSNMRDLIEVDMVAQSFFWKRPETETVILRPVHILGRVHNAPSNYLRQQTVPTVLGFDPMIQVVHQNDVVHALVLALAGGVRGVFNIAGPDPVSVSRIIALAGKTRVPVPHFLFRSALRRLWSLGATSFPDPELDFIRYVCMVDDGRARREMNYFPQQNLRSTVAAIRPFG